ncbi:hypothetical protein [uncultured Megasphaera sp.]|uniref:SDH family Clp fold serine proteinase n=1 Tax=uncultured Megasphaera sp. TaxID=165188 RepID=UPI0025F63215|nr:hypothetical protein [uncultured Megasphaera sp.]
MPNWMEVSRAIENAPDPLNVLRKEYLSTMCKYTGRNIIAYYSAFLQKPNIAQTAIDDNDKNAFMQAVCGLNREKGLDLILHTPGGNIAATESLVFYLKQIFGKDIRVFVPQIAMSAGTMIALSAKEIVMGKHSNLGPIDPQYGGMSCAGILDEFNEALKAVKEDPNNALIWKLIIGKYHPTFVGDCKNAIEWSEHMVKDWLMDNMFFNTKNKENKANKVVAFLSSHNETYSHSRHIHSDDLLKLGLKIRSLETLDSRKMDNCKDLQDCVLTLHHIYMQTLANSNALKIVENQNASCMMFTVSSN